MARPAGLTERTVATAHQALAGRRGGFATALAFAGPAIIASVAYMDPGNFATNIQAGAKYGYGLLWIVLLANVMAMLFQSLSAKLGIVTGRNLAELCRDHFPRLWCGRCGWSAKSPRWQRTSPSFSAAPSGFRCCSTCRSLAAWSSPAIVIYGLLMCESYGFRPLELIIGSIVGLICLCYFVEMFIAPVDWAAAAYHTVTPQIADAGALLLAVGIIGATVMPHAIYLHSGLTQARVPVRDDKRPADAGAVLQPRSDDRARRRRARQHGHGDDGGGRVSRRPRRRGRDRNRLSHADPAARRRGGRRVPGLADRLGRVGSTVGTMAGQMIMQGFTGMRIPVWLRRLVTMLPAFVVVALGANATNALVISQVVLAWRCRCR